MTTPEVREELTKLAVRLRDPRLTVAARNVIADLIDELVLELHRRKPVRPITRAASQPMSTALARRIRAYAWSHTDQSIQKIADRFRVNTARVSEAVTGKRT